MGKSSNSKKRRRSSSGTSAQNVDLFCNVTGLEGPSSARHGASIMEEACLAEMDDVQQGKLHAADMDNDSSSRIIIKKEARPTQGMGTNNNNNNTLWKNALVEWITTGRYTVGVPSPCVEVSRHFYTQQLSSFLLEQCSSLRMPSFERWWIDSKWDEYHHPLRGADSDPVIPGEASVESSASQRLVEEAMGADDGMTRKGAIEIVHELCLKTNHAFQQVSAMASRRISPLGKGARIELTKGSTQHTLTYTRKSWKKPFAVQVNATHYDDMWQAFCRVHDASLTRNKRVIPAFRVLVFCLLLRYSSLSGGHLLNDLRGGGMQGAIMPDVFDALKHFFPSEPTIVECFASPWNVHNTTTAVYASAFPDLDGHFGSIGDFREIGVDEGTYEVNPPFSPGLMIHMVKQIQAHLATANENSKRLTYFVVVPTANTVNGDSSTPLAKQHAKTSFDALIKSPFCRLHIVLPSREHGYVEGAQHLRPTRYKQSPYDTSLILMQSDAGWREGLNHDSFERKLRKAFASRHEEEIQQRQQNKKKT